MTRKVSFSRWIGLVSAFAVTLSGAIGCSNDSSRVRDESAGAAVTTQSGNSGAGGATSATVQQGGATVAGTVAKAGAGGKGGGSAAKGGTLARGGAGGGGAATAGNTATVINNEFWISPSGSDSNPGTKALPLFSFCDAEKRAGACYKLCGSGSCKQGTIWVMDGTYTYSATQKTTSSFDATESGIVKLFAAEGARPVFDFSGMAVVEDNRGLQLGGNYWHVKGITVTNAGDTGIFVMGSNVTVEQCVAHHNHDTGIVIGTNSATSGSGQNNLVLNCDSYQNNDAANGGENADGFGMKESSGTGNAFRGCRAWDNADDGWDLFGWKSPVTIDNCWAISQSKSTWGFASDGNGFKLGGNGVSAKHILSNLYAADNMYGSNGSGFTSNSNPAAMSCSQCAAWGNKLGNQGVSGISPVAPAGATAAKMIEAKRNADGSLPDITSL